MKRLFAVRLILVVMIIAMTGCADSTGWRFEIGVSPVKSLSNNVGLKQEDSKRDNRY